MESFTFLAQLILAAGILITIAAVVAEVKDWKDRKRGGKGWER